MQAYCANKCVVNNGTKEVCETKKTKWYKLFKLKIGGVSGAGADVHEHCSQILKTQSQTTSIKSFALKNFARKENSYFEVN